MKTLSKHFITTISIFLMSATHAAESTNRAGIYSSLRYIEESGDLLGMELLLVPEAGNSADKYAAVIQLAEGGLPQIVLSHVEIKDKAFNLIFKLLGMSESLKMQCKFDSAGITCKTADGQVEKMKRGKSYWQGT